MSFTTLPIEMLQAIAGLTLPEGYEGFMLSCKTCHKAGEIYRTKHNKLTKQYRDFRFEPFSAILDLSGPTTHADFLPFDLLPFDLLHSGCKTPFDLFISIYNEPLIARYIVRADLSIDKELFIGGSAIRAVAYCSPPILEERLLFLTEQSSHLRKCKVDPKTFCEYLLNEYNGIPNMDSHLDREGFFSMAFLLTLLPNLEVLKLPRTWTACEDNLMRYEVIEDSLAEDKFREVSPGQCLVNLLDAITTSANQDGNYRPLSRLHTVNPSTGTGYELRGALEAFCPFLGIKSLQTFRCGGCSAIDDGYTGLPFHPERYLHLGTNLETVELAGICTCTNDFRKFLSRCKKLKVLRLAYEVKWHGSGYSLDAGALAAMIEEETKSTLEVLSLTMIDHFVIVATGVASMNRFEKLKDLELDMELLLAPPHAGLPEDLDAIDLDKPKPEPGELSLPSLVQFLPASCESFRLISESSELHLHGWRSLLSNYKAEAQDKLPSLKKAKLTLINVEERNDFKFEELVDPKTWDLEVKTLADSDNESHHFTQADFLVGYDKKWSVCSEY